MMAGANPADVQATLRCRDPRITTEIYGHLAPGYLRAEIDRLHFNRGRSKRRRYPRAVANSDPFDAPSLQSTT
jgi:hypothetical protein